MKIKKKNHNLIFKPELCARKGCVNDGVKLLTIIYLHKIGWFCEKCVKELISNELVEEGKKLI
jgi:hypothetical protein